MIIEKNMKWEKNDCSHYSAVGLETSRSLVLLENLMLSFFVLLKHFVDFQKRITGAEKDQPCQRKEVHPMDTSKRNFPQTVPSSFHVAEGFDPLYHKSSDYMQYYIRGPRSSLTTR